MQELRIAIQIGTNNGNDDFSKEVIGSGYDQIYLIEPHKECNESIEYVYKGENVYISNIAITPDPDPFWTTLYNFSDDYGNDSVLLRKSHPLRKEKKEISFITVNCMPFQLFCSSRSIKYIDYLCIDTEGLDAAIIDTIDFKTVNIRKIKWEKWIHFDDDENGNYPSGPEIENKMIEKLKGLGYEISIPDGENYIAIIPPDMDKLPWIQIKDEDHVYEAIRFLPDNPVIVEAGACDAYDTLKFKKVWPKSTIHAFEPNTGLFEIAKRNLDDKFGQSVYNEEVAQWKQENISLYPFVLSNGTFEIMFFESDFPATSSVFQDNGDNVIIPKSILDSLKVKSQSELLRYKERPVPKMAIDLNFFYDKKIIDKIDYLWLDTEGSELLVLKGATKYLPTIKVISLELNFQEFRIGTVLFNTIYDYLITRGFDLVAIWQDHENWQANGIFVRRVKNV